MQKKILLLSRHAPYGTSIARDAIDAALATAVYDQDLSILFMDDGVFQLLKEQDAQSISQKSFTSLLSALPYYDIEKVYVHKESLEQRCISPTELVVSDMHMVSSVEVVSLFSQQEHILSF